MQDGGTDRAPIDRGSDRAQPTRPPAKKNRVKQLSLAAFLQQRGCSCFIHITWSVVIGPDCAKPIPLRVYGLPRQTWLFLATCKVSGDGQMLCLIGKKSPEDFYTELRHTDAGMRKVVHANSLPEMARLKVEGLYVIPYLCVEQPQPVSIRK
jgi:hypothetical protein